MAIRIVLVLLLSLIGQENVSANNFDHDLARGGRDPVPSPVQDAPLPRKPIHPKCLDGKNERALLVTHYYVPLLKDYDHFNCDQLEGTCIYQKNGVPWLHNYGYQDQPLSEARCKNGYGNKQNCIHPCRSLAASMTHHTFGEIIFFKELVGMKCGNAKRDGVEFVHDGFMVVTDTGSPKHFNKRGRFDYFWGRCKNFKGGECFEGATDITAALSHKDYCMVWNPNTPSRNRDVKTGFIRKVKAEARKRGDKEAADDFDL